MKIKHNLFKAMGHYEDSYKRQFIALNKNNKKAPQTTTKIT